MNNKKTTSTDLTNKLIIENIKVITHDMRIIKQSLLKLMGDVNYCVTQGDVISQILEESQIAGKNEIPDLVETIIDEREIKVKNIFEEILEQVEKVKKDDDGLSELKKLLKDSPTTGEA